MKPTQLVIASLNKGDLATTEVQKDFVKQTSGIKVFVDNIAVRKGFNLRTDFGDIKSLAASIESEGLKFPITVDILADGTAALTDGERRFRAIQLIRAKNKELKNRFEYIDALTNEKTATDTDRIVTMLIAADGKPLDALEEAEGFRRLRDGVNEGDAKLTITEIAKRTGRSVPYVEQSLLLVTIDEEEKQLVKDKKISPTAMKNLVRKEKSPAKRKETIKKSGGKVKVKDVKNKKTAAKAPPKSAAIPKLIDEALAQVKAIDKKNQGKDGEMQNMLFELDAKLREIKKLAK